VPWQLVVIRMPVPDPARTSPPSAPAGRARPVLRAVGVSRLFGDRRVLTDVSLAVAPGHRLAVVGENGAGKSTLLRLLAGVDRPDAGSVQRPGDLAYLHQEPPFGPDATLREVVDAALTVVRAVADELERSAAALGEVTGEDPAAADRYDLALARAQAAEVWDADARAQRVLAGLGLADLDPGRPSGTLSGGQRSRLALAAVLVRRPGAVLLDEPTNHLDDAAAEFLAAALVGLPGAVVLASHDRVFLDEVGTEVLDLDPSPGGPRVVGGRYADHREAQRVARRRWQERWEAERAEVAGLRDALGGGGSARTLAPGRAMADRNRMAYGRAGDRVEQQVSRRVRDARRRLDELEAAPTPHPPRELRFRGVLTTTPSDGTLVAVRHAVVPGRLAVDALDVHHDTALLVTGPNGSGKSTLLHLLAGDLAPAHGTVQRARGARVALLEQDVGLADDARTPRVVHDLVTGGGAGVVPLVELGLVAPRDVDRPLRELSVGQRRRVVLALLVAQAPDVLLLDEPTNHVSLALADELAEALRTAPGAVVVASHDRWLRRTWHGAVTEVVAGRLRPPG